MTHRRREPKKATRDERQPGQAMRPQQTRCYDADATRLQNQRRSAAASSKENDLTSGMSCQTAEMPTRL
jgi:hypothetical protein